MLIKFPVYVLRGFTSKEEVGGLVLISSAFRKYVLDDTNIGNPSFLVRRVVMLTKKYDHPIYPLKNKCESLVQLILAAKSSNTRPVRVIELDGNIKTYIPSKLVRLEWKTCKCIPSGGGQYYNAIIRGEPTPFILKDQHKYVGLITYLGSRHIVRVSDVPPKRKNTWIKI